MGVGVGGVGVEWGWVAGLTKNKANSAQLGLAGAWAELANIIVQSLYCSI